MTRFSEKMLISTRCIHGFMSNLIKKSWTDSIAELSLEGEGGAGEAPPEFGVSEKRTEREMDSLLLPAPPDLKT